MMRGPTGERMNRRSFLLGAAFGPLAGARAFGQTFAQSWPDRAIRIVVPFAPGSFTDVAARLVATELTEQLGQPVVVENRGGAGSTAGTLAVVRAEADGYTLLLTDISLSISPGLYPKLPYDPLRDLAQISRIADSPAILLARPGLGARTLAELVALARQDPGKLTFGSGGPGSSAHLAMELFLNLAGIQALHVPFRGIAAAIAEMLGGRVDMAIGSLASGLAQVQSGALVGLGITGTQRNPLLPDVPTFAQAGQPGFDVPYWFGLAAPAATPAPIIERLNREVVRACAQPRLKDAFARQAAVAVTSTPDEMTRHLAREIGVWREVIARANISIQ
jgi:tripartite-type tricarboxylate transporter receptor subunit TctC